MNVVVSLKSNWNRETSFSITNTSRSYSGVPWRYGKFYTKEYLLVITDHVVLLSTTSLLRIKNSSFTETKNGFCSPHVGSHTTSLNTLNITTCFPKASSLAARRHNHETSSSSPSKWGCKAVPAQGSLSLQLNVINVKPSIQFPRSRDDRGYLQGRQGPQNDDPDGKRDERRAHRSRSRRIDSCPGNQNPANQKKSNPSSRNREVYITGP